MCHNLRWNLQPRPQVCALTENLLVNGMMLQPTEPYCPGWSVYSLPSSSQWQNVKKNYSTGSKSEYWNCCSQGVEYFHHQDAPWVPFVATPTFLPLLPHFPYFLVILISLHFKIFINVSFQECSNMQSFGLPFFSEYNSP